MIRTRSQRIVVGLALGMFLLLSCEELDEAATILNVSRQAVIKLFLRHALDHHYMARKAKNTR